MRVKDLMVPIREYAKVGCDASLYDALLALEDRSSETAGRQSAASGRPRGRCVR